MPKLNIAVIGSGNMGKHHARVYSELPTANLVAICDANAEKAQSLAKQYGCLSYGDYKKMFKEQKIDAVSIAVPTFLHHEVAMYALDHNVNVLVEKPIAINLKEADKIIKKARSKKLTLMVGHIERFNPAVRRLAHLIQNGRLGDIISINIRRVGGLPPQTKNANVIMDLGIHDIDIANFLLQSSPVEIHGFKSKSIIADQEDNALILLKYPTATAFIEVNWVTPVKIRTLDITGTKAFAQMDYINQKIVLYENSHLANKNEYNKMQYKDFNEFISKFCLTDSVQIGVNKAEPLKCELEEFISAIQEKRKPAITGEDARRALETALKI